MTFSIHCNWQELGSPKLFAEHKKYLKDRAISDEVIRLNNLRSLRPEETAEVWPGRRCEVLLAPYGRHYGSGRAFDSSAKFLTTADRPNRHYAPSLPKSFNRLTQAEVRANPDHEINIIEGPFKTLSAISNEILAIGISGCWNWQKDRQVLPGLRSYVWDKRRVTPIFDADISDNNRVLLPYLLFCDWLVSQGADVKFLKIKSLKGGKTGLDDYLARYGKANFAELKRDDWSSSPRVEALRISGIRNTEGGLASLLALRYSDAIRYDNAEEAWYAWNGVLWERQPKKAPDIQERVKDTVSWIIDEANSVRDRDRRKQMLTWGIRCDKKQVLRGAMDLASSDRRLRISISQMDQDHWLLGTKSGIVDLRTGEPLQISRAHMVTRSVGVAFDPAGKCPRWRQFISEIMLGDKEMIAFIQTLVGYLLLGGNPLRLIFFLHGIGRNGKSVFIETLLKLMGDYGEPAKSELIMKRRADRDSESAQPFMLKLRGKRYITASEVGEGMQLDAAVVKTLTGGDEMTVRGLHSAPVKFTVEGKFVIRCNHRPIIDGADQAIWDRVVEIPFDMRLDEAEQDTSLRTALLAELPGILNWAIRGCMKYQQAGLVRPQKVRDQIKSYRDSQDSCMQWLEESAVLGGIKDKLQSSAIYRHYENWCARRSARLPTYPITQKAFTEKLIAKGCRPIKSHGERMLRGIRWKGDA
jgi:putative DNA primase/helicase